mmetsp:Transcript_6974/g.20199  ORF Transcript_6974/g.20199 Transcript_6974/m.20199 type:complete len:328 (-) Transcript_6974:5829-6812(-)
MRVVSTMIFFSEPWKRIRPLGMLPLLLLMLAAAAHASPSAFEFGTEEPPAALAAAPPPPPLWKFSSCQLFCANGGYCRFLRGTAEDLSRLAQGGTLVETCRCPSGFTGNTCQFPVADRDQTKGGDGDVNGDVNGDVDVDEASTEPSTIPPEQMCHGRLDNDEVYGSALEGCDCALADAVSFFAGTMCRRPVTEYCMGDTNDNDNDDDGTPHFYCTNGGRCRTDVVGATFLIAGVGSNSDSGSGSGTDDVEIVAIARSGNHVTNNDDLVGCICPSDFYGPHCEFLRMERDERPESQSEVQSQSQSQSIYASTEQCSNRARPDRNAGSE